MEAFKSVIPSLILGFLSVSVKNTVPFMENREKVKRESIHLLQLAQLY